MALKVIRKINFYFQHIRYCLKLDKMIQTSKNEFQTQHLLPLKDRFNKSINSAVLKYFTKQCPSFLNKVFELACPNNLRTRNNYLKLICPFWKTNMGHNIHSFFIPSIWNSTIEVLRKTNSINTFKHNVRKYHPAKLK